MDIVGIKKKLDKGDVVIGPVLQNVETGKLVEFLLTLVLIF